MQAGDDNDDRPPAQPQRRWSRGCCLAWCFRVCGCGAWGLVQNSRRWVFDTRLPAWCALCPPLVVPLPSFCRRRPVVGCGRAGRVCEDVAGRVGGCIGRRQCELRVRMGGVVDAAALFRRETFKASPTGQTSSPSSPPCFTRHPHTNAQNPPPAEAAVAAAGPPPRLLCEAAGPPL